MRNRLILGEFDHPVQTMINMAKEINDVFNYEASQIYQNDDYEYNDFDYGINFKENECENLLLLNREKLLWLEHDYGVKEERTDKIVEIYNFIKL